MDTVVVMARGLGNRMRREDESVGLRSDQKHAAESGIKALVPFDRPFLDYVLTAVADAGYTKVCLVIGPEHEEIRTYYTNVEAERLSFNFAIQHEPKGTADAVLAAQDVVGDEPFLVINSDNHYPCEALLALRQLDGPGLACFDRDALIELSNIPAERIAGFAVVEVDTDGFMCRVHEKPSLEQLQSMPEPVGVSMNCWRLGGDHIFDACKAIDPSPRGEFELPAAVQYSIDTLGVQVRAVPLRLPVLDLTSRIDIDTVGERVKDLTVRL